MNKKNILRFPTWGLANLLAMCFFRDHQYRKYLFSLDDWVKDTAGQEIYDSLLWSIGIFIILLYIIDRIY